MFILSERNEYGNSSILASSESYEELIAKGKEYVSKENCDGPLVPDQQKTEWEYTFIELPKRRKNSFYAGRNTAGKHQMMTVSKTGAIKTDVLDNNEPIVAYLGVIGDKEETCLDHLRREITTIGNEILNEKTIVFVRGR